MLNPETRAVARLLAIPKMRRSQTGQPRCVVCGATEDVRLCDAPVGLGFCNAVVCGQHATTILDDDDDFCPAHAG